MGAPRRIDQFLALIEAWKRKDIDRSVAAGRAGIQAGLTLAHTTPEHAYELRSKAKACAFDVGSFTWPGWDEAGITLLASHYAIGRDAAHVNLRLAQSLEKGAIPVGRAHWLVGAFHMVDREWDAAKAEFSRAEASVRETDGENEGLLALGYSALVDQLAGVPMAEVRLEKIRLDLTTRPDGTFLSEQLEVAQRVFTTLR